MEAKLNIYRFIEIVRQEEYQRRGKRPSVFQICDFIVKVGGYHELIACEDKAVFPSDDRVEFGRVNVFRNGIEIHPDGYVLLTNSIQCGDTLRRRYYEAKKFVKDNELEDIVTRQIAEGLGRPREDSVAWASIWLPPRRTELFAHS